MKSIYQSSIILLLIILATCDTIAQYSSVQVLEEGTDQDFEFIEDINGDGIIDAVLNGKFECAGDEYLRIYHGKIDGMTGGLSFDLVYTNNLDHGFFFYLMDMNGDGHKEVVSQHTSNGDITIARFENGQYEAYVLEDPEIDLTYIDDIDNDGIDENIKRQGDIFYRGNFDDNFNYVESVFMTKDVESLALYDYDVDGILDYFYFDNDSLHILLIDGGLKEEILIYDNDLPFIWADERLFYDVDQNGDVDFIYRPESSGSIGDLMIAWNIGANGFNEIEVIAQTKELDDNESLHYLDLDFDGNRELVIKHYLDFSEYIYLDAKSGDEVQFDFEDEFDSFDHFSTQGASQIVIASDYSSSQEPLAVIQYSLEADKYIGREIPIIIPAYTRVNEAVKTDLNMDGKIDLLFSADGSAEYGEKTTVRWISDIDGLGHSISNPILGPFDFVDESILLDIDNDGDFDIVSANNLTIYYNNGLGEFSNSTVLENGVLNNSKLKYADINNDGLLDLILLRRNGDLIVYKNIDGADFESSILGNYNANSEMGLHHIDKDQNIDITIVGQPSLITYVNDGNGDFPNSYTSSISSTSLISLHDIDQDGDVEYIYEDFGQVGYLGFNDEFVLDITSFVSLFEGELFEDYNLFDVDKDGDLDLMTSSNSNDQINWYEVVTPDSVVSRGLLNSFLILPEDPYLFSSPYLEDADQFVIGACGKIYMTQAEVESIKICVHADKNDNNMLDGEDYSLVNHSFSLSTNGIYTVLNTDESGCVNVQIHSEDYVFNSIGEGCFGFMDEAVTVDESTDVINLLATENGNEGGVKIDLTSAPTRCGFTVEHWLTVRNKTCDAELISVELEFDEIALWNTILSEDEFNQFEKFINFDISDVKPGESKTFKWTMEIPDFMNAGEYLDHKVKVVYNDGADIANYDYRSEIRCAYDPNDKSISPDRTSEFGESYVTDELMTYLIRFQNVGNDTAFNIVVRDTLSTLLDLNTLQDINTSHNYNFTLDTLTRILQFNFDDIRLVDSLTNERDSHGFIKFSINSVEDLDDFTPIYNTAGIYFDFNPPVITNRVEAKYVHDLSILTSTNNIDFANNINVSPNPASHNIKISGLPVSVVNIDLFSASGQKVFNKTSSGKLDYVIDISTIGSGLYFLKISDGIMSKIEKVIIY